MTASEAETVQRPLRIPMPRVALTLDPHRLAEAYSMAVALQVHRGLLRYTPGGNVVPDLAASWTTSEDGLEYRFQLRASTFSDGSPITATDVRRSFERLFRLGSGMSADLNIIRGSTSILAGKNPEEFGVREEGEGTVVFRLDQPSEVFLKQLAAVDCAVLKLRDGEVEYDALTAATSGPYRVHEVRPNELLALSKWRTDPFDSPRPPERVEYRRLRGDLLLSALGDQIDSLDREPLENDSLVGLKALGWREYSTDTVAQTFIILQPSIPIEWRKWLFVTADPDSIARSLSGRRVRPSYGLIPSGIPGALERSDYNRFVAEYPHLRPPEGARVGISLEYSRDDRLSASIAAIVMERWLASGVDVTLLPLEAEQALGRMFAGKGTHALVGAKGVDYFDGYSVLSYFRSGLDFNYFHTRDPLVDQGLDEAARTRPESERLERYKAVQAQILRNFTVLPIVFGGRASGMWSPRVTYVPAHPLGPHYLPLETIEMARAKEAQLASRLP